MYAGSLLASAGAGDEWDVSVGQGRAACSAQKAEPLTDPQRLQPPPTCVPLESLLPRHWEPSPFPAWTPPRSPQVPPFSDAPGRGRGWGGATSQLPQPQNKLTSPAGSLLMGPHGGGRQMEWTLSPEPGVPAPSCPGIGAPMEPRVNTDCDATFQEEGLLSSCQETL